MQEITPSELEALLQKEPVTLVDVREIQEWQGAHFANAIHWPLSQAANLPSLPEGAFPVVVYCAHGVRSRTACRVLADRGGVASPLSLSGGLARWYQEFGAHRLTLGK